jgi:hypothetical protein
LIQFNPRQAHALSRDVLLTVMEEARSPNKPDLIQLDVRMPVLDGEQFR